MYTVQYIHKISGV